MENIIISSENLSRQFRIGTVTINALNEVSLAVNKNEFVALMGASGSGKSTLMNLIGCLDSATSGSYNLNGTNVKEMDENSLADVRNKEIGFIFQTFNLLPRYTALENVILPLIYAGSKKEEREIMAEKALENVGLSDRMSHKPNELSGGMRRRLLIARALLHHPSILVLDEPTTGLDPQSRHMVWDKLVQLKERGMTLILTTHYMDEAEYLCDRLVILDEGRILVEGISRELVKKYAGEKVIEIRSKYLNKQELIRILGKESIEFEDLGESIFIFATGKSSLNLDLLQGYDVITRSANLEDVFLRLTGRGLREE